MRICHILNLVLKDIKVITIAFKKLLARWFYHSYTLSNFSLHKSQFT